MKNLIVDLDGTLTIDCGVKPYSEKDVNHGVVEKLRAYQKLGFKIIISTSRNMRTFDGNVGEINIHTLPVILKWLDENNIPYDEVLVGKPWCGFDGFYIDDKAIRPSEFVSKSYGEIKEILNNENSFYESGQIEK